MTRRPAASSLAMIGAITFLGTASGLMIENVRSMAMSDSLEAGSYPRGAAGSMRHRDVDVAVDWLARKSVHAVTVAGLPAACDAMICGRMASPARPSTWNSVYVQVAPVSIEVADVDLGPGVEGATAAGRPHRIGTPRVGRGWRCGAMISGPGRRDSRGGRSEHHVLRRAVQRHHAVGVELSELEARDHREPVHG